MEKECLNIWGHAVKVQCKCNSVLLKSSDWESWWLRSPLSMSTSHSSTNLHQWKIVKWDHRHINSFNCILQQITANIFITGSIRHLFYKWNPLLLPKPIINWSHRSKKCTSDFITSVQYTVQHRHKCFSIYYLHKTAV